MLRLGRGSILARRADDEEARLARGDARDAVRFFSVVQDMRGRR